MQIVVEWKAFGIFFEYLEIDLKNQEKCAQFETRIWCRADGKNYYWKAKSECAEEGDDFYINVKYEDNQEDEEIILFLKNEEDRNAQFGTNKIILGIIYGSAQAPDQSGRGTVTTSTGSRIVRNASSGVISGRMMMSSILDQTARESWALPYIIPIILERDRRRKVGVKEKGRFEWSGDNRETYCGHWRTSDARRRAVGKQLERDKQFRNRILSEDRKCVITGETFEAVLDAAHICPVKEFDNDGIDNGLVLRADIHRLYDREVFFIDPRSGKPVIVDPNLPIKYMTLLQNAKLQKKSLERVKRSLWNRWNDYNRGNNGEGDGTR